MVLTLDFEWEEAPGYKTLSNPGKARAADQFADAPSKQTARHSAFYRNLVRLAEQTGSRTLPINFLTADGVAKRMDYGCMKIAEHAGFIERIENSPSGVVNHSVSLEPLDLAPADDPTVSDLVPAGDPVSRCSRRCGDHLGRAAVIDGDTIEIRGTRIRLWGIDARERPALPR